MEGLLGTSMAMRRQSPTLQSHQNERWRMLDKGFVLCSLLPLSVLPLAKQRFPSTSFPCQNRRMERGVGDQRMSYKFHT